MQSTQTPARKTPKAKSPERFDLSKKPGSLPYIWKRISKNGGAMFGLILLALIIVLCILSPYIMKYDYTAVDMRNRFAVPSLKHLFGCDELGRDIMSRIFFGARYTLTIGIGAVAIAAVSGIFIGAIAGYFGGKVDAFLMRILDVLQSFPGLVSAIAVATVLGTGLVNSIIAIGISFMPQFARLMRANIFAIRDNEFVEAAALMNCSTGRIIMRHLIPNAISPIIVQISMSIAQAALTASTLSFLGLGVKEPRPEWGSMISSARSYIREAPHMVIIPGIFIMITLLSLNLLGDAIRDALDPRLKD
jgi:ABC-type dipeptide/oligopeptide/nickel transport system permease subunit